MLEPIQLTNNVLVHGENSTLSHFKNGFTQYQFNFDKSNGTIASCMVYYKPKEIIKLRVFQGDYFILVKILQSTPGFISPLYHLVNTSKGLTFMECVYIDTGNFLPREFV